MIFSTAKSLSLLDIPSCCQYSTPLTLCPAVPAVCPEGPHPFSPGPWGHYTMRGQVGRQAGAPRSTHQPLAPVTVMARPLRWDVRGSGVVTMSAKTRGGYEVSIVCRRGFILQRDSTHFQSSVGPAMMAGWLRLGEVGEAPVSAVSGL